MLLTAEGVYSKARLRSLQDEWVADYPPLIDFAFILRKMGPQFRIEDLDRSEVENFCLDYAIKHSEKVDFLSLHVKALIDGVISLNRFLTTLFHIFYRTGLVGLKTETFEGFQWSHAGSSTIAADTLDVTTSIRIHPTFWRVLGIKPD